MEDRTFIPSPDDLFFNITSHEISSSSADMNEDGELLGRFSETPRTYTDPPDEPAVSVLKERIVNKNNNRPPSKEETSLSGSSVCLSKCRDCTSSTWVDVPTGLSSNTMEAHHSNGYGESSSMHDGLTPRIVVTGTRVSEAFHPGQPPLYTEGDEENIDDPKVPAGEAVINKPYLQNPIVSHCGKGKEMRYLVWQTEGELNFQKSEWLALYWEQQGVLERASKLPGSRTSLPKRKRNV
ncbi:hypothetical protein ZTR_09245 [Talaromyces verruculosus]|nr:hypothetical protein ZTR_09245 [Talaromyces verruculosus]